MEALAKNYADQLEAISTEIQASDELAKYLETEEEEDYNLLKEQFETRIANLHEEVAENNPLQLVSFEKLLLHSDFEGLFLPRVLGYSVLRGELSSNFKYVRPQFHFQNVLMSICNSANFDILKKRIGQTIQMGFALSSDIWVTNLINEIDNRRVNYYLKGHKQEKYRQETERRALYARYLRQFTNENFQTAAFPKTVSELKTMFNPLKNFLIYRIKRKKGNQSIFPHLNDFIANPNFQDTEELMQIVTLYGGFFDYEKEDMAQIFKYFNALRKGNIDEYEEKYFRFIQELHDNKDIEMDGNADQKLSAITDRKIKDDLSDYYDLMDIVHTRGYIAEEAQEAVKNFYNEHEGRSTINRCVRRTIYSYLKKFIVNLQPKEYPEYIEITKYFTIYMGIFANQKFNQSLKELSMRYVKKLIKFFTDKRGKDYQDIKRFVSTAFKDFGFLKQKEIVELFKTRRKRRTKAEA